MPIMEEEATGLPCRRITVGAVVDDAESASVSEVSASEPISGSPESTNENMTGFIDPGTNPLSAVTVQALGDLGYLVNIFGADDFSLPFSVSATARALQGSPRRIDLGADVLDQPIVVVQRDGRVRAIIRP